MANIDFVIYTMHSLFWLAFVVTRAIFRRRDRNEGGAVEPQPVSPQETAAPFSRALVAFHALVFAMMYVGIGIAVIPHRVPAWFTGQQIVGSVVIAGGAALVVSALIYFRSWRFRAAVDTHHQLATGGPFRLLRHPIYMGLNLLALGSAIWVPTAIVWAAFVLMAIGSDLRARAEETLLTEVFGSSYREYTARTRRFIPGIY
jgi:protein-S-isoprenylcysteine O-methyltransferase Ste14